MDMSELGNERSDQRFLDEFTTAVVELAMAMERDRLRHADGYIPICDDLMLSSVEHGGAMPPAERFRYLMTAGRKLDGSHLQLERTRQLIDVLKPLHDWYSHNGARGFLRDKAVRDVFFLLVHESELTLITLYRAMTMIRLACRRLGLPDGPPVPVGILERSETVAELRHAFEHIDDRLQGKRSAKQGDVGEDALGATMLVREGLLGERRWKYRDWSLGVDAEATDLMRSLADYLRAIWNLTAVAED
jgi:hypothetical protein